MLGTVTCFTFHNNPIGEQLSLWHFTDKEMEAQNANLSEAEMLMHG